MVATGCRTTIVATVLLRDPVRGHLCVSEIKQQKFRLLADLKDDTVMVSLLNMRVTHLGHPTLQADEHSAMLEHKVRTPDDYQKLAETCTGLGGIGIGAKYAGWQVTVQNELQRKFHQHLSQFGESTVVPGSICLLSTIRNMHEQDEGAACMAWGYACQPFSLRGDQRQGQDVRSETLSFGLFAAYILRKDVLVLECVVSAASSGFVRACLHYHQELTRSTKSEIFLELADTWVSKRKRYWTVVVKDYMGKVLLHPMPKVHPAPNINSLLPGFLQLQGTELAQLKLSEAEHAAFTNFGKGIVAQLVNPNKVADTALHSWGNQIHQCACECRGGFLTHQTTKTRTVWSVGSAR